MANDARAAVQAGVDVKMMLTFRLAEALGYADPVLDFDDLCELVRAFAAPYPAVEREALAALFRAAPNRERLGDQTPGEIADALLARYDIRERGETG